MPWSPSDAYGSTHKATTPLLKRAFAEAGNSALAEGYDDGAAKRIANAAVLKTIIAHHRGHGLAHHHPAQQHAHHRP